MKLASYSASDSDSSQNTFKCQVWDAEYEYDLFMFKVIFKVKFKVKGRGTG